jgi:hypothetical protein
LRVGRGAPKCAQQQKIFLTEGSKGNKDDSGIGVWPGRSSNFDREIMCAPPDSIFVGRIDESGEFRVIPPAHILNPIFVSFATFCSKLSWLPSVRLRPTPDCRRINPGKFGAIPNPNLRFLRYLLFKFSLLPSDRLRFLLLDTEAGQAVIERPGIQNLEVLDPPGSAFLDHREKGGGDLVTGAQEKDLNDGAVMFQGGWSKL